MRDSNRGSYPSILFAAALWKATQGYQKGMNASHSTTTYLRTHMYPTTVTPNPPPQKPNQPSIHIGKSPFRHQRSGKGVQQSPSPPQSSSPFFSIPITKNQNRNRNQQAHSLPLPSQHSLCWLVDWLVASKFAQSTGARTRISAS